MIFYEETCVENNSAREQLGLGWDQSTNDETAAGPLPLTQGALSDGAVFTMKSIASA
jgi:hypothetical protein